MRCNGPSGALADRTELGQRKRGETNGVDAAFADGLAVGSDLVAAAGPAAPGPAGLSGPPTWLCVFVCGDGPDDGRRAGRRAMRDGAGTADGHRLQRPGVIGDGQGSRTPALGQRLGRRPARRPAATFALEILAGPRDRLSCVGLPDASDRRPRGRPARRPVQFPRRRLRRALRARCCPACRWSAAWPTAIRGRRRDPAVRRRGGRSTPAPSGCCSAAPSTSAPWSARAAARSARRWSSPGPRTTAARARRHAGADAAPGDRQPRWTRTTASSSRGAADRHRAWTSTPRSTSAATS